MGLKRWRTPFLCLALCSLLAFDLCAQEPLTPSTTNSPHSRVVIMEDPDAISDLQPVADRVQAMVDRAITNLTGKTTVSDAWLSLVSTKDVVGLKVCSTPGQYSGTRPAVAAAIITDLIAAGLPPTNIIVWDRRTVDLRLAGFFDFEQRFGVRVMGSIEAGYDEKTFYETAFLGPMDWTDVEYNQKGPGMGRKSYVSRLVSKDVTKIINITPMMHHNIAGVYGTMYSLTMASVDNTLRFENNGAELDKAVPEIYALPVFGDKVAGERVVLTVVDALICQFEGQDRGLLHYSTVLDQLRFSRDPVALDVLSLQEINHQRELAGAQVFTNTDMFDNASLLEIGNSDPKRIDITRLP
jgi:Domain of unknown function (DUF362)